MLSFIATAGTMAIVDVLWIGLVAKDLFDKLIGNLLVQPVRVFPALLFYVMYVTAIYLYGVLQAKDSKNALLRGASLGFVCYATYEFTNWAILKGWPGLMVAVDLSWGIFITSISAFAGRWVLDRLKR